MKTNGEEDVLKMRDATEEERKCINNYIYRISKEYEPSYGMIGWICPVCGRGLSPYTYICPCKNGNIKYDVTC